MFTAIEIKHIDNELNMIVTGVINVNLFNIDVWYISDGALIIEIGGKAWETTLTVEQFIALLNESLTITGN